MKGINIIRCILFIFCLSVFVIVTNAQDDSSNDSTKYVRLKIPSVTKDIVGGETQNWYVFYLKKGQTVRISFLWKAVKETNFSWSLTTTSRFEEFKEVKFGKYSKDGKSWTGTSPFTRKYYIYTTAHPVKKYTLSIVKVKRR